MTELSVIIATFGQGRFLRDCLDRLCHQTQPAADFEVIVVGNACINRGWAMLRGLDVPYRLRICYEQDGSQAAAWNHGVAEAVAPYCLFLGEDVAAAQQLVAEHIRVQREHQGVIGVGHLALTLPPHANGLASYIARSWSERQVEMKWGGRRPSYTDCYGANLSMPRSTFLEAGGCALDLPRRNDVELAYRLECQGLSIIFIPGAEGQKEYRRGFREITAEAEKAGIASVELYRRHPPMLPHLELGAFNETSLRAILLRRALLAIGGPLRSLRLVGPLLGRRPRVREWYRFLYSYCYWRGVRRAVPDRDAWRRFTRGTPILMYHAFGLPGELASTYVLPGRRFSRQMAVLKWLGCHVLSLEEFLQCYREHRLPPARSVVITIDDGYADNWSIAYPILRRYSFPATIFLVSGLVGTSNQWDREGALAGRPLLSWAEIRAMLNRGIHIGAHTRTHVSLSTVLLGRLEEEVAGARADLERALGVQIRAFSYPNGKFDATTPVVVERAGFLGACCSYPGVNDPATPRYVLRRTEIRGTDSFFRFVLAVSLGSKWILPRAVR
jgi:peptidoglycan/xylan/chitin deacetylase (PgdA/CDA1 family)